MNKLKEKLLKLFYYHPVMAKTMLDSFTLNVHLVNLVLPLVVVILFYDYINFTILYIWFISMELIVILRILQLNKIKNILDKKQKIINSELNKYLFILLINGLIIGSFVVLSVIYAPIEHIYFVLILLMGIISGAVTTLSPIFIFYFIFILGITVPSVTALFFSHNNFLIILAVVIIMYVTVVGSNAYRQFSLLLSSIKLQEKYQILNESLEQQIDLALKENTKKEKLLQQQSRLAQMGEMIKMIAHQWRQPLSAISSSILSIQTKKTSPKYNLELKDDMNKFITFMDKKHTNINGYVQTLSSTIDDFRNFFKPDRSKEKVNLTLPIKRALNIVEGSMHSKNIFIQTEFLNDDEISMYQNEMMQVLLNILKNAEDNFIEESSIKKNIKIKTYQEDEMWIITIFDNGGGIPEDILQNIFDPYFSTKDEKNGTGLGLYMSKIIVEEHNGGKLNVYNIDDGVTFKIILSKDKEA